nr:MAG: NS1 [Hedgehog chapparvovirus 5]
MPNYRQQYAARNRMKAAGTWKGQRAGPPEAKRSRIDPTFDPLNAEESAWYKGSTEVDVGGVKRKVPNQHVDPSRWDWYHHRHTATSQSIERHFQPSTSGHGRHGNVEGEHDDRAAPASKPVYHSTTKRRTAECDPRHISYQVRDERSRKRHVVSVTQDSHHEDNVRERWRPSRPPTPFRQPSVFHESRDDDQIVGTQHTMDDEDSAEHGSDTDRLSDGLSDHRPDDSEISTGYSHSATQFIVCYTNRSAPDDSRDTKYFHLTSEPSEWSFPNEVLTLSSYYPEKKYDNLTCIQRANKYGDYKCFTGILQRRDESARQDFDERDIDNFVKMYDWKNQKIKHVLFITEMTKAGVYHCHFVFVTTYARTDSLRLALEKFNTTDNMIVAKIEKIKNMYKMLRYLAKDSESPYWQAASSSTDLLEIIHSIATDPLQKWEKLPPIHSDPALNIKNDMTMKLYNSMKEHNCTTLDELIKKDPVLIAQYLHRSNLEKTVKQVRRFLQNQETTKDKFDFFKESKMTTYWKVKLMIMYQGLDADQFGEDFFNWIFHKHDKRNCFVLYGPSNTGKSSFIRNCFNLFTVGEILNGAQFQYGDLIGKQLGRWEEPLITPQEVDKCKLIFEGTPTTVAIKYQDPALLDRTPIFITTNKHLHHFCSSDEKTLKNRCFYYTFSHDVEHQLSRAQRIDDLLKPGCYSDTEYRERTRDYLKHYWTTRSSRRDPNTGNYTWDSYLALYRGSYERYCEQLIARQPGHLIDLDDDGRSCSKSLASIYCSDVTGPTGIHESAISDGRGSDTGNGSSPGSDSGRFPFQRRLSFRFFQILMSFVGKPRNTRYNRERINL